MGFTHLHNTEVKIIIENKWKNSNIRKYEGELYDEPG